MAEVSELVRYLNLMEEVKRRISLVEKVVLRGWSIGEGFADYEFVALQFRKILEIVAFASLIANKDAYKAKHAKFASHWKAKKLLEELGKINPAFYPVPFVIEVGPEGVKHLATVENNVLTTDEFVALYDKCSDVLHSRNPFDDRSPGIHFGYPPLKWLQHIGGLLSNHHISFADDDGKWVITLADPSDGKAHGFSAQIRQ